MISPVTGVFSRTVKSFILSALWPPFFYMYEEGNTYASNAQALSITSDIPMDVDDDTEQSEPFPSVQPRASPFFQGAATPASDPHHVSMSSSRDASHIPTRTDRERTHVDILRGLDARGIKHRDYAYLPATLSHLPENFYVKDHAWSYEIELLDNSHRRESIHPKRLHRLNDTGYYRLEEEQRRWSDLERTAFSAYVQSDDAKIQYQAIWGHYPGSLCKTYKIAPLELKRRIDTSKAPRWVRPKHPHAPGHSVKEPGYFDTPPPGDLETADDRYQLMRLWLRYKTLPPPPKPLTKEGTETETEDEGVEDEEAAQSLIQRLEESTSETLPELRGRRHGGTYIQQPPSAGPRALRRDRAIVGPSESSVTRDEWSLEDLVGGGWVGDIVKKGKTRAPVEKTAGEMTETVLDTPGAGPSTVSPPPPPNPNGQRRLGLTRTYATVWRDDSNSGFTH